MLRKGMAIIICDEIERQCFVKAANKLMWTGTGGSKPELLTQKLPVLICCKRTTSSRCLSYTHDITYVPSGNMEIIEASQLFKNQIISERRKNAT